MTHPSARPLEIKTPAGVFDALAAGPAGGREVLLLHGFPEGAMEWDHQLGALAAAGCHAVAPDQRGYSPGVRPGDVTGYRMDELVGDVLRIADALGWQRFDLVGHDWGAVVGWAMADRSPDRLRTLTAVSIPHPRAFNAALAGDEDQQRRSAFLPMLRADGAEERLLADGAPILRGMLARALPAPRVDGYLERLREPGALTGALNWYRATRPQDLDAGPTGVPTLFVWGTEDAGVGATAARGTAEWAGADYRFEALDGVSHWVPEEAAELMTAHLVAHLRRHPAG